MITFLKKYSTVIFMCLLVTLLVLAWVFPSRGLKLGIAFLLLTFFIASVLVLEKHKQAYRKGEVTRNVFIRNATIEVIGTGLMMALAGPLGRAAARITTQSIGHDVVRIIAGIGIGLIVGMGVGFLAKKTLRRLVDVPPAT